MFGRLHQAADRRTRRSRHNMAATPPSLTTPPPPPTDHQPFLSPQDYPDIFSFMPPTMPNVTQNASASFGVDGAIPDPPAPPPAQPATANTDNMPPPPQQPSGPSDQTGHDPSPTRENERDESSSDDGEGDSDDDEDERGDMDKSWYSIFEEKREPVEDELRYWKETPEHSASDHAYWQGKAFADLGDPQLRPGEAGRIDFAVDRFNGTREKPNKESVMRSQSMDIGGCTWRLKFYPKGNNTDHLSVYIENVTMQAGEWEATEDFAAPPLPFLSGEKERPRKRRCVAAQVCVVLYNPAEPRQYEYRSDAHQFTKDSPDYGWTRFTHMRRRDLGLRNHFQRAPLLQDDRLAFKAYIRVIDDPTGCLWDHNPSKYGSVVAATGLRPFSRMLPILAADVILLHFRPFQELVFKWQQDQTSAGKFVSWMNILLWKMLSRERSEEYGDSVDCQQSDPVAWLQRAVRYLQEQEGPETAHKLLGKLDDLNGSAVSGGRLQTRTHPSVQVALDALETTLETPALLTLELERQHFEREKREWKRVTNKVDIQEEVTVGNVRYKLFALVTHCGDLSSNNFKTYVRPHGANTVWYGYSSDKVTCMTHKQVMERASGRDEVELDKREKSLFSFGRDRRGMHVFRDDLEVAHVVFYVREDYTEAAFARVTSVDWTPPRYVRNGGTGEETTGNENGSTVVEEKEVPQESNGSRRSIASQTSAYDAGCATPTHWFMDEDGDVVMSESEDDHVEHADDGGKMGKVDSKEPELVHRTMDNLGCAYYHGQMLGSQYHGEGHLITLNGDEYTGSFSHGSKHGAGKLVYASNGDVYEGEWSNGERHGRGKYIEASTGNVFEGTWKHDKKSGKFTLTGTVTEEDKGVCGICYEREMNTAFYDCGHVVACFGCAQQIEDCPVCRRRIVSRLQLFGVKVSLE